MISFDDHTAPARQVKRGMDQGCPVSAIAYQYYNADLLEMVNCRNREDCVGFVDDTTVMAEGVNLHEAFDKLRDIMTRAAGALEWADTHQCLFEVSKFGLMGLTRRREKDPGRPGRTRPAVRPSITIGHHTIKPTMTHKCLGVILDQELRFREHANYALKKGEKYIA